MSDSEGELDKVEETKKVNKVLGTGLSLNNVGRRGLEDIKEQENNLLGEEIKIKIDYEKNQKEYTFRKGHGVDQLMLQLETDYQIPLSKQELYFNSKIIPNFLTFADIKGIDKENTFELKHKN